MTQLSCRNPSAGRAHECRRLGFQGLPRGLLRPGLCCGSPRPQGRGLSWSWQPFCREVCWSGACRGRLGALHPRGLEKQGLKADFSLIEEVSLGQYNRGVSAAPALHLESWASCQSQNRPWKKRQHEAPSLDLCMRRSMYQNLRFPEGACPGVGMEPAPRRACSMRPCPSRMPGLAPLPLQSLELRKGGGATPPAHGGKPRGAEGLARWLEGRQRPRALAWPKSRVRPCAGSLEQTSATVSGLPGLPVEGGSCSPFGPETEGMGQCRHLPQRPQGSCGCVTGGFVCGAGPSKHS